jgi:hypothetical protein
MAHQASGDAGRPPRSRRTVTVEDLIPERREAAKRSFTTRRVPLEAMRTLVSGPVRPRPSNVVLARVTKLGHHRKLELPTGRRAQLHPGDEIIVAYANRYASDQFESYVPLTLGPTNLVASGGVASEVLSRSRDVRRATEILPVGLVADERGIPLSLADFALEPAEPPEEHPPTLVVIGTSMNSGKTTTIHRLVESLGRAGHDPGVTKVTGTGSGGDYWVMQDSGAHVMLDFTDVGMASTFKTPLRTIEQKTLELMDLVTATGCGCMLVEIADGLLQQETAHLMRSPELQRRVDGVLFTAGDAMGAIGGVERLREAGLHVVGVAGRLTRSPLATQETADAIDVPIYRLDELGDPRVASRILGLPEPPEPDPVGESEEVPVPVPDPAAAEGPATVDLREVVDRLGWEGRTEVHVDAGRS